MSETQLLERPDMEQIELEALRELCVERNLNPKGSYQNLKDRVNRFHDEQDERHAPEPSQAPPEPPAEPGPTPNEPTESPNSQHTEAAQDGPQMESVTDYLGGPKQAESEQQQAEPDQMPDAADDLIGLPDEFVTHPSAKRKLMSYVLGTDREPRFKFADVLAIKVAKDERDAYQAYRKKSKGNCVEIKPYVAARRMYKSKKFPIAKKVDVKLSDL